MADDELDAGEAIGWGVVLVLTGVVMFAYGGRYCIGLRFTDGCLLGGQTFGMLVVLLGLLSLGIGAAERQGE